MSTWTGDCTDCAHVYLDATGAATRMWAKRHAARTGHTVHVECISTRVYRAASQPLPKPLAKPAAPLSDDNAQSDGAS